MVNLAVKPDCEFSHGSEGRNALGGAVIAAWQGSHLARRPSCLDLSMLVSIDLRCRPIEERQPSEQDLSTYP
jgi:hypothetical protein